jgi:Na+-translocating ferredoxin:NAD+ oxidoreductase subunit B
MTKENVKLDRRRFLGDNVRAASAAGILGLAGWLTAKKGGNKNLVWQIDPDKCIACGHCQTHCVLDESAVKAVQCFSLCGYCDVCTGFFPIKDYTLDTGAENQLCPTDAIRRKFIEEKSGQRFFEYTIDESLCIGCGKCVAGCKLMNGSLYLQVRHDRCQNCNECSIAVQCPSKAFIRVNEDQPNILKKIAKDAEKAYRGGNSQNINKRI